MASSGKLRPAYIIGTFVIVLFLATAGTVSGGRRPADRRDRRPSLPVRHRSPRNPPTGRSRRRLQTIKTTTAATLLDDGFEGSFPGGTWQLYHDSAGADRELGQEQLPQERRKLQHLVRSAGQRIPRRRVATFPSNTNSWVFAGPFDLSGSHLGRAPVRSLARHGIGTTTTSSGWRRPTGPTSRGFRPRPTPAVFRP